MNPIRFKSDDSDQLELPPEADGTEPRKQAERKRPPGHNLITKLRDGMMMLADGVGAELDMLEHPGAKEMLQGMVESIRTKCEECESGRSTFYPDTDEREDVKEDEQLKKNKSLIRRQRTVLKFARRVIARREALRNQGE